MTQLDPYKDWPADDGDLRPTLADDAPLVVREHFYLEATRRLVLAEGSETSFELARAANAFARSPLVQEALRAVGEADPAELDEASIDMFIAGVLGVKPHNRYPERWLEASREVSPETAEVLRSAAFSFLTAWVHRYGPLRQDLDLQGTWVRFPVT